MAELRDVKIGHADDLASRLYVDDVVTGAATTQAAQPKEQLIKDISLQHFFYTFHPLGVKIYQVAHPAFRVGVNIYPIRVCFVKPPIPRGASAVCMRLGTPGEEYQDPVSAELSIPPGAAGKPEQSPLVIQAIANAGPSGRDEVHGLFVWSRVDDAYPTFT